MGDISSDWSVLGLGFGGMDWATNNGIRFNITERFLKQKTHTIQQTKRTLRGAGVPLLEIKKGLRFEVLVSDF